MNKDIENRADIDLLMQRFYARAIKDIVELGNLRGGELQSSAHFVDVMRAPIF